MPKICDNKSVGQIILKGKNLLMIERKNYPESFALPAGHLDGDEFLHSAFRETKEEVGISIVTNDLVLSRTIQNPCKREHGSYHHWAVYKSANFYGKPKEGSDAKNFFWASPKKLQSLVKRTEYFIAKYNIPYIEVGKLTEAIFGNPEQKNTDSEWMKKMGIEPVWYYILKELKII